MLGRGSLAVLLTIAVLGACDGTPSGVRVTKLAGGGLRGTLEKLPETGATFTSLESDAYPGRNVFQRAWGGLNFEHILNGAERDAKLNWYTPRTDPHTILPLSGTAAVVRHAARDSSWGIESRTTWRFPGDDAVDLTFRARLTEDRFPRGWVAFMWASYVRGAVDQLIHFRGRRGDQVGWQSFGHDPLGGCISAIGAQELPHDATRVAMNASTDPTLRFELPFYYGLLDGDDDPATPNDRMVYLVMFDRTESIRFSMWNRAFREDGRIDVRSPAWDWQYVIRDPVLDRWYGYRARIALFPWRNREQILARYRAWSEGLPEWNAEAP